MLVKFHESENTIIVLVSAVLNALKNICTATDILTDPSKLPEQATRAVTEQQNQPRGQSSAGPSSPQSPLDSASNYTLH